MVALSGVLFTVSLPVIFMLVIKPFVIPKVYIPIDVFTVMVSPDML